MSQLFPVSTTALVFTAGRYTPDGSATGVAVPVRNARKRHAESRVW